MPIGNGSEIYIMSIYKAHLLTQQSSTILNDVDKIVEARRLLLEIADKLDKEENSTLWADKINHITKLMIERS